MSAEKNHDSQFFETLLDISGRLAVVDDDDDVLLEFVNQDSHQTTHNLSALAEASKVTRHL